MTELPDWSTTLEESLTHIWAMLGRGVSDRRHGFHHPMVATIGHHGAPQARVVILRGADRSGSTLRFHTDKRSDKVADLLANSAIAVTFYDFGAKLQIRISGHATLRSGRGEAEPFWSGSQAMSKVCYGTLPAPGSVLTGSDAFTMPDSPEAVEVGFDNFTAVIVHVESIEWLYLRQGGHRRATHNLVSGEAHWLAP